MREVISTASQELSCDQVRAVDELCRFSMFEWNETEETRLQPRDESSLLGLVNEASSLSGRQIRDVAHIRNAECLPTPLVQLSDELSRTMTEGLCSGIRNYGHYVTYKGMYKP